MDKLRVRIKTPLLGFSQQQKFAAKLIIILSYYYLNKSLFTRKHPEYPERSEYTVWSSFDVEMVCRAYRKPTELVEFVSEILLLTPRFPDVIMLGGQSIILNFRKKHASHGFKNNLQAISE